MQNKNINYYAVLTRLLILVDSVIFFVAFAISHQFSPQNYTNIEVLGNSLFFAFVMQLAFLGLGIYKPKLRDKWWGMLRRLIVATALSFLFLILVQALFKQSYYMTESLFNACLYSLLAAFFLRSLLLAFNVLGFAKRNVLVLGAGERATIIEQRMRRKIDRQGFNLIGFVYMPGDVEPRFDKEKVIHLGDRSLLDYIGKNNVQEIVIATDERRENLPIEELFACKLRGVVVSDILDFFEQETGQIAVNLIYPSWLIFSDGFSSSNEIRNNLDWLFNASLAAVLFLLTWPIMLLTYIAIKLEDGIRSPGFYWQERVGLNGHVFKIVKFRSMRTDAERHGIKWSSEEDDRVTRVGRFIRKYRIDELPQIYNVINGDMGFVGPRPERPEFVEYLQQVIPYYYERHNVKSGLTGWAQLKYPYGSSDEDALEKLKYDLYYIKHRSFFMDLLILIQTAEVVLLGKGR
ncbi:TIGR03013 family XrtA/PEP-CTERM system glycosyltransferase [Thalassotalea mangrovi]|uniref:TIGR03013 family PEP-CTERM/XrtA system glycosyltransferase n=1 Tax=Thalassotalea mangrovi TaxID=2572245 RepID=A0A4U1B7M8_9GAMM|nr:TIGR03013 family XrtA/PEP-CTERM system glycosyltransferase [Thalassotalea mangrovi]TKB46623.1 TIGR03013 family PEP-CTERM/XrtA system glycosyltransferase [Thalassotalea mangrovi]